ncbi:MAG: ATP-dependent helicase [Candidatus Omnitrophica bacterium]|jgi:DNA helicase-2/ATP-dependent DNA helicase PcrA|nr:ATP-dependent helicase [Candidatus Omnitrophota bacterium]
MKTYRLEPFLNNSIIDYEKSLNSQQLKVVEEAKGPSLVLAGAGSGKTRVLIYRLAYLLERGVLKPNILLVTFTNRAANEMINRAELLLKSSLTNLWAGTFHHIGNIILRKESKLIGYSSNFTIVDKEDAKDLIEDCLEDLKLNKSEKIFPKKDIIYNIYNLAINSQKDIETINAQFYPHIEEYTPLIIKVISCYEKKKKEANIMDFSDLLSQWLKVLNDPAVCEKYSKTFEYILVDEYQDTNKLQFEILKRLAFYHKNILAVGDDAQSIYSFRAADINNILDFPKTFENTKIFKLQLNYRSSPEILSLANEIIKHNLNQFPKTLEATKSNGPIPYVVKTKDVYQQARFVAQRIVELNSEGINLGNIAVLFRSRFQALELEMELLKRNIPYLIRGGLRFFEQAHIKDVFSYLKIILNDKDELSFKRAICLHRGIGRSSAYKIWNSLMSGIKNENIEKKLPQRQRQGFKEFLSIMKALNKTQNPKEALEKILENYKNYCYLSFDNPEDRILDLEELTKLASDYSSVKDFLLDLSSFEEFKGETLLKSQDIKDFLTLSTIHQAKGLEWETVFIIGFCEYDFPHPKSFSTKEALEEERRLFYVATTRTKTNLYISYPQTKYSSRNGIVISRPSMFLHELPKETYEELAIEENFKKPDIYDEEIE